VSSDMRHLTTGLLSEKCVVTRFCRCVNVYVHKLRQYSLLLLGYKPVQHATILNTVDNSNTMVL